MFIVEMPTIKVVGADDRFPVRRISASADYADQAREMGSDPDRQKSFFFAKPALTVDGDARQSGDLSPMIIADFLLISSSRRAT